MSILKCRDLIEIPEIEINNHKKEIACLRDEIWPLKNPFRFKHGDQVTLRRFTGREDIRIEGCTFLNETPRRDPRERWYYIAVGDPKAAIQVMETNEEYLCRIEEDKS